MKEILTKVAEETLKNAAQETTVGIFEICGKFASNYTKRRNVGFTVIQSTAGSFKDTKKYYGAILTGRDPVEMKEAFTYEK